MNGIYGRISISLALVIGIALTAGVLIIVRTDGHRPPRVVNRTQSLV